MKAAALKAAIEAERIRLTKIYIQSHLKVGKKDKVSKETESLEFIQECIDCPCCKGFVHICVGDVCDQLGICYCVPQFDHEHEDQPDELDPAQLGLSEADLQQFMQ